MRKDSAAHVVPVATRQARRSRRPTQVEPGFWDRAHLVGPLAERDIGALFRALQEAGLSQRAIARLTHQSQSEISEVLAGRRIRMVHVLERVADGLGIPRGRMGLAEREVMEAHDDLGGATSAAVEIDGSPPWRLPAWVAVPRTGLLPVTPPVFRWTGAEVRMLRHAMRMSVREFAAYIGISDRMVSKWEAGRENIVPRPINQAALDTVLARASAEVRARFAGWPTRTRNHAGLVEARRWVMHVVLDVSTLDAAVSLAEKVLAAVNELPDLMAKETMVSPEERPFHRYAVRL